MQAYYIRENEEELETRVFAKNEEHAVSKYIDNLEAYGGNEGIKSLTVRNPSSNKETTFMFPQ